MWLSLVDDTPENTPTKSADPVKLLQFLDVSEKNIRSFFKVRA